MPLPDNTFSDSLALMPFLSRSVQVASSGKPRVALGKEVTSTDVFVNVLRFAEGRQKVAALVQYSAKILQALAAHEETAESMRRMSSSMSGARKGLRYFKLIEEWNKLLQILSEEKNPSVRFLAVVSKLCSMCYLVCDHALWWVHLGFVTLKLDNLTELKRRKNMLSVFRYITELPVQTATKMRSALQKSGLPLLEHLKTCGIPRDLILKYVELLCNLLLAVNGLRNPKARFGTGTVGVVGCISAVISLKRFWKSTHEELTKSAARDWVYNHPVFPTRKLSTDSRKKG